MTLDPAAARDSDQVFRCQRLAQDIPLAAPRCLDPKAYCKGRPACPIHLLEKEAARLRVRPPVAPQKA